MKRARSLSSGFCFFFNDTATTEIYTLSLHDALPISRSGWPAGSTRSPRPRSAPSTGRSEEHTSELQSHVNLVCRLLLEKKNERFKGEGGKEIYGSAEWLELVLALLQQLFLLSDEDRHISAIELVLNAFYFFF